VAEVKVRHAALVWRSLLRLELATAGSPSQHDARQPKVGGVRELVEAQKPAARTLTLGLIRANLWMKQVLLAPDDVAAGYEKMSEVYFCIPPLIVWRAWELAAYKRYSLREPILDLGCGDGQFFRQSWPDLRDVVGVDFNPETADLARRSGIYREVYASPGHDLPLGSASFSSAFANCSLEHMDRLPDVLVEISRTLRPESYFLLSVVTDKFPKWATLPLMISEIGDPKWAESLQAGFETYHHLANPLPLETWTERLEGAGFQVLEHIPIMPEMTSRVFLFLDHLWHIPNSSGEIGNTLYPYFQSLNHFSDVFQRIMTEILQLERDWTVGSGAVFLACKAK
jgi:SAM-dependent methyltransferase